MSFSTTVLPWLAGGASGTVFTTGVGSLFVKLLKRVAKDVVHEALDGVAKQEDVKAIASDVTDLKVKLAAETGGNSHGLRQAVNELTSDVSELRVDVAALKAKAAA